jgi:hypothetical protein
VTEQLVLDRFDDPCPPGEVVGGLTPSGARRLGADRERSMSIDHGRLRIRSLEHGGWGRASLSYGPFERRGALSLAVRLINGLTTSQTDARPEGGRAMVRRWLATFPDLSVRRRPLRDNLAVGFFRVAVPRRPPVPVAAVINRAGDDATGELWFQVGGRRVRLASGVQNLPVTYLVSIGAASARLHAWSYPGAHGYATVGDADPVAELDLGPDTSDLAPVYAGIHQPVLGEVGYRVDTRVDWVRVLRSAETEIRAVDETPVGTFWTPCGTDATVVDTFVGPGSDLHGTPTSDERARWGRVLGQGVIERRMAGRATVRASVQSPNPGRTAYCIPWNDPSGVLVSVTMVSPGLRAGEGHRGRGGLVIWQDAGNHLVVNHFIDDGSVGVSISAFLRRGGHEIMHDWDAVWSNLGDRIRRASPFRLAVACDGAQFLCLVDGEPVLHRFFSDYHPDAAALEIRGVGLAANWEWGDDTGTTFHDFVASPLTDGAGEPLDGRGRRLVDRGAVSP